MAKAVRFHETGGPEVLRIENVEVGEPGSGQVRLRHEAGGLNFADTYFRSGLYPVPLPAGTLNAGMADSKAAREGRSLTVEVFVDFICPWCLIGKRNLETALRRLAELRPDVRPKVLWKSHQLLPDTPASGIPYQAFYLARLGSPEAVAMRRAQVQAAGHAAGIAFAFERIDVLPNTALAHNLVACAAEHGTDAQREALVERLFTAFFVDCRDIGNRQVLAQIGQECGLNREAMLDHLADSSNGRNGSSQAEYEFSGVPTFVFNGEYVLSGALSPYGLVEAMLQTISD